MKKILTLILIITATSYCSIASSVVKQPEELVPTINIADTKQKEPVNNQSKPLKVKTTILTKKVEKTLKFEESKQNKPKKDSRDIELPSDVDKILKEMDIDDIDPIEEMPAGSTGKTYAPVKKNFLWVALSIVIFPIILFVLLIKTMQLTKNRFEEEKKEGPSKEEQFLDEIEKAQKTTKKKRRSLSEILGHHPKERQTSSKFSKNKSYGNEDDFDRDDEDFEFMVEEVVLVEEKKEEPKKSNKPKSKSQKEESLQTQEKSKPKEETSSEKSGNSGIIDSFEIAENLKFILTQKNDSTNLICLMNNTEIVIMELEKAQKFNKVRKIDSKPGRDVYMIKLDSWRGLVEVKENSVKYLMDI